MTRPGATIKDVASCAGVSTATVSRVLNGDKGVSAAMRESVQAAVARLGYNLNTVARSLKTRSTKTIGVLAPNLSGDFFMFIAESLDRELSSRGYGMVVCSTHGSPSEEALRIRNLTERLVDGVVVIPATNEGGHFEHLHRRNIPVVFIDRMVDDFKADAVLVDNEEGAYQAVRRLIADGHSRIGFIGGTEELLTSRERLAGYKRALAEAGLPLEPDFVKLGPPVLPFGYRAMEELMKRADLPDALFLVNAFTHVGATNYLLAEGGPRGRGIVFAAFDHMPYSPLLRHCRYSVQQPMAELGRVAAKVILDRISGRGAVTPRTIRLKTRLIKQATLAGR